MKSPFLQQGISKEDQNLPKYFNYKYKGRPYALTLGDMNFYSENRLPGFAEDTSKTNIQKDAERRNKKTLNPKPKAEVFLKK